MSTAHAAPPCGLPALEQRLAHDLLCLGWPARAWMPPQPPVDGLPVLDVAIIGAGQAGLAVAACLAQNGIHAVLFDRQPPGLEGPWATTARMETLRSPKELTGPALGVPALTFRTWYEAQFGADGWAALDKIPRLQWMDYLRWYRRVLALDVRNQHAATVVQPHADGRVLLQLQTPNGTTRVFARRVVLATGRDGLGGPAVPAFMAGIDRRLWAHSSDPLDHAQLAGLRVGVVGAGSSAMDSAATALEAGARSVDLLIRRPDLPRINKSKGAGVPGMVHGHHLLADAQKWRLRHYINQTQVPPPQGSTMRVSRHPNARFHFGSPVQAVSPLGQGLRVTTPRRSFDLDFLFVSTGFQVDWHRRPEYAGFADQVRAWKHRHTPEDGQQDGELADSPDLGPLFEFQPRTPGACPGLERIHCFCYPATLSHGTVSGDIPAISDGARRLATGLAALFYREDFDHHLAALEAYADPELLGHEWMPAP